MEVDIDIELWRGATAFKWIVGPKSTCGKTYSRGLSYSEKKQILDYHNKLRSAVATGLTSQPGASDMVQLEWDDELEYVAQAHADTCQWGHDCNTCRKLSRWRNVGQNLYMTRRWVTYRTYRTVHIWMGKYRGWERRYILSVWNSNQSISVYIWIDKYRGLHRRRHLL